MMVRILVAVGVMLGGLAQVTSAQTNPPVIRKGQQAGTTADLRLPLKSGVGTCRGKNCPPGIRFRPGQRLKVEIFNRSNRPISIEKVAGSRPLVLEGRSRIAFYQGGGGSDNQSIVFWEDNETPIRVKLSQPQPDTLSIDLSFAARNPGDQSVYVRNDGQVEIF